MKAGGRPCVFHSQAPVRFRNGPLIHRTRFTPPMPLTSCQDQQWGAAAAVKDHWGGSGRDRCGAQVPAPPLLSRCRWRTHGWRQYRRSVVAVGRVTLATVLPGRSAAVVAYTNPVTSGRRRSWCCGTAAARDRVARQTLPRPPEGPVAERDRDLLGGAVGVADGQGPCRTGACGALLALPSRPIVVVPAGNATGIVWPAATVLSG